MSLIEHADGRVLDHIGWGVPDVASGVETLAARTGVDTIQQPPPDPSLPFSNAVLRLTNGSKFVEVIGPNPKFAGDHPFGEMLAGLSHPRLLFWYVAVESLDAFEREIEQVNYELASIEHVKPERDELSEYKRGVIDSHFPLTMPTIIEWTDQSARSTATDATAPRCSIQDFRVEHPAANALRTCFADCGIDQAVVDGQDPALEVTLDTPEGTVTLSGSGRPW